MIFRNSLPAAVSQMGPRDAEFVYNESGGHLSHMVCAYFFDTTGHPLAEMTHDDAVRWITERFGYWPLFTSRLQRVPLDLDYPYWSRPISTSMITCTSIVPLLPGGRRFVNCSGARSGSRWTCPGRLGVARHDRRARDRRATWQSDADHAQDPPRAGDGLAIRDLTNLLFSGPPKPQTKRAGSGFRRWI